MIIKLSFPEYGCITGCNLYNSLIISTNCGAGGSRSYRLGVLDTLAHTVAGGADWEVFGRALIPIFDLPKTITTTVFTLYDAPFAQVDSHGFNGSFRLSYMLGNFFLCCIRFFLKVFQYGHFFQSAIQSAIFALWIFCLCLFCTLSSLLFKLFL